MSKLTIWDLQSLKGKRQITMTTAHDYHTAKACEQAGIDVVVTWGASLETMSATIETVRRGAPNTLITAALPQRLPLISNAEAIRCAVTALNSGADMIYTGTLALERTTELFNQKIPCVGHVGLVPGNATWIGGLRAVGRKSQEAIKVYADTLAFQRAGAVALEMECVPYKVAAEITKRVDILVISMGSGSGCDGQYLFSSDMLGTNDGHYPRHTKRYRDFLAESIEVFRTFKDEVNGGVFPAKENVLDIKDEEFELFMKGLDQTSQS